MELNTTKNRLKADPTANEFVGLIESNLVRLRLEECKVFYRFPLYRGDDGLEEAKIVVVSKNHGIIVIETTEAARSTIENDIMEADERLDVVFGQLHGRLTRNKTLRQSKKNLSFPLEPLIFAPGLSQGEKSFEIDSVVVTSLQDLQSFLDGVVLPEPIPDIVVSEIASVIEGAKGMIIPQVRPTENENVVTRANLVNSLEAEIANFDADQKHGYMEVIGGPQRIRGLAGSGKTVVLAMKAAITHLRHPEAHIVYTFYTRSLHQHVKRLITRFYRQFDDRDPNWEKISIMHAWGGASKPGVYSEASSLCGFRALTYSDVSGSVSPFDAVCTDLLNKTSIPETYDFVFVDEGQDFPASFLKMCLKLSKGQKFVYAYDELQNIFQTKVPSAEAVFGPGFQLEEDVVLKKCYRNPREILVSAHALGFGLYSSRIVQMLENKEHWEDVGYSIVDGDLTMGSTVKIFRPEENSPSSISQSLEFSEILSGEVCADARQEVLSVARRIARDINKEGLRPEDIVVICVDDKYARGYFGELTRQLIEHRIQTNNIVGSSSAGDIFTRKDSVTLSSIHRAKGNEGYSVYVMGMDALFKRVSIRNRNMLFTALTRAKAWVHVTGVGENAAKFNTELAEAEQHFPYLEFKYPGDEELQVMKRDLMNTPSQRAEKVLEELLGEVEPEQISAALKKISMAERGKFSR